MPEFARRPHRSFDGRNGFAETFEPPTPSAKDLVALNNHRAAHYVVTHTGSFFPSRQQILNMKNNTDKSSELQNVKERIKDLQKRHLDDLERLYDSQAQDYLQDALDRYHSKDDSQFLMKGENNYDSKLSYAKLDSLYFETRKPQAFASEWDDALDRLRVAYLKQILPLQKRRAELEFHSNEARRRQEAQFPGSSQEYRAIRQKDMQRRVARFLVEDKQTQEAMMTQFGWAWRQVQPLKNEYQSNSQFKAEIHVHIEEVEARDPRRRSSL